MDVKSILLASLVIGSMLTCTGNSNAEPVTVKVSSKPMHSGRVTPMFYGSFVELWDDHVQGMWAEMLNDRNFDGVEKRADWNYYIGEPNTCDREWDKNSSWSRDDVNPFNSSKSAKLTSPGSITQSGLAVKKGMTYLFLGHFRTDNPKIRIKIVLKTFLPDDSWMTLASADLKTPGTDWTKLECKMESKGTTDKAVFEIQTIGSGNFWADKVSLMPADNVNGWRRDVVDAIKELGAPIIRWGGCVVDPGDYRWKQCIGDRDCRVPFPNQYWGRIDPNDVGIDEFLQFCEAVGAKPLICVSFADGAENARDLVEYCNGGADSKWGKKRAENGHLKPYNVKYWQLGNELGDAEYVKGVVALCKAIKGADPESVIFTSFPSEELLAAAADYIDYICPHYYRDDFDAIQEELKNYSEMANRIAPKHNIKIAVTEWNFTNPWGLMRGRLLSVESIFKTGQFMNMFYRNSDMVQLTCRSNLCNSLGDGIIQTSPSGLMKPPSFYVMKLYKEHSKPVPVTVTGAPDGVDIMACTSEDGKSVCVYSVNTNYEKAEIQLDLSDFVPNLAPVSGEVVCDTYNYYQMEAQNLWSAPNRIKTVPLDVSSKIITLPSYSTSAIECK